MLKVKYSFKTVKGYRYGSIEWKDGIVYLKDNMGESQKPAETREEAIEAIRWLLNQIKYLI